MSKDFDLNVWETEPIGTDWNLRPRENAPLIRNQQMDQFLYLRSDILMNVIFWGYLGHGSFGRVWKVTTNLKVKDPNNPNSSPVWKHFTLACKVIHHKRGIISVIRRSLVEAKMLTYLRHENICNLAEVIGIPDRVTHFPYSVVCIFYEICDGDLSKLIQQHRELTGDPRAVLSEKLSRHWFAQIALALEYIHANNVVHQDIKQPNILYKCGQSSGNGFDDLFMCSLFKLTDFGEAMYGTNIPQAEIDEIKGHDVYRLGKQLTSTGKPQDNKISPEMLNLLGRMDREQNRITSREILSHPWLQNNKENQTERFILRSSNVTVPYTLPWEM